MPRRFAVPYIGVPQTCLLANGSYAVMLTAAGAGYSRWRNLAVTRWREDGVRDENGSYVLLRDTERGDRWSASWQPRASAPQRYEVEFSPGRAQYQRTDSTLTSTLTVAVTAEGDGEVRRIALRNDGDTARSIELASFFELILGSASADAAHPAFSKMFVQTAQVDDGETLLAWRRKRDTNDPDICAAHLCTTEDANVVAAGFETDRARFIGRCADLRRPAALVTPETAPGSTGTVLDPIFSLRRQVSIAPGATVHLAFWTVLAGTRDEALAAAARCRAPGAADDAIAASAEAALASLEEAGLDAQAAERFQRLATPLLYADSAWRAPPEQLARGEGGPPRLWAHGVSGDRPIVLARLDCPDQLGLAHELLAAQAWWRGMQLAADLVIVAAAPRDAAGGLDAGLDALAKAHKAKPAADKSAGALFVLQDDALSDADRDGLATAARVVIDGRNGDLATQLRRAAGAAADTNRAADAMATPGSPGSPGSTGSTGSTGAPEAPEARPPDAPEDFGPTPSDARATPPPGGSTSSAATLEFFNGIGGFAEDGREYAIELTGRRCTPMPWVNVIANEGFGFMVSAEGGGYSWAVNSQTNPLTPWSNDPVRDPAGDLLYLRDADSGLLWTATPEPIRAASRCRVSHGRGYSRFEQDVDGVVTELLQFVPVEDPVKISRLRLRNESARTRRLQITAYVEWALGAIGTTPAPFVTTGRDEATGALTARNAWRAELGERIAFADLCGRQHAWTCDRREFLGSFGTPGRPAALAEGRPLAGRCGAGMDPCAALQATIELAPGEQVDVVFLLGEAADAAQARALVERYRAADPQAVLDEAAARWQRMFDTLQVRTPDRRLDLLVNGWLPYQVLSCRVNARTAFYQASGAWGFRDQLQDVMALALLQPQVTRAQLLRAAGRQFLAGDVQHWWLPPSGAGVRTHIADDRLWLPYAVAHYVETTGDAAVLDEDVPFLDGPPLPPERVDDFYVPKASDQQGSLFEHCARAIEASLALGSHDLPLFGTGDWNDGMNRVGNEGRGESVWMAWFLHVVLTALAPLADARGEKERAKAWRDHAAALARALDARAWDGQWWLRGWYDDGRELGSHVSTECQIDSLAQSWGVISGAADGQRARRAMEALDRLLVRRDARLVELFAPPFDRTPLDPGYIKGYPPGIRENGGQYTHGAVWAVVAFAMQGDGDRAAELFSMLEPISHSGSAEAIACYQVEPYVACADVYTAPGHVGRGGWTWYTGTAGWLYRAAVEWMLGLRVRGATLRLDPCIPRAWPGFDLSLRYRSARYEVSVENSGGVNRSVARVELDGALLDSATDPVPLVDDGAIHRVRVVLG